MKKGDVVFLAKNWRWCLTIEEPDDVGARCVTLVKGTLHRVWFPRSALVLLGAPDQEAQP